MTVFSKNADLVKQIIQPKNSKAMPSAPTSMFNPETDEAGSLLVNGASLANRLSLPELPAVNATQQAKVSQTDASGNAEEDNPDSQPQQNNNSQNSASQDINSLDINSLDNNSQIRTIQNKTSQDSASQNSASQDNNNQSNRSLQNQIKRQREWVYLVHYLAIQGLDPVHIISGQDDGHEPDFTLVFWEDNAYWGRKQLVYIGLELTTLPRLRTQISDIGLIGKRWYWQGLHLIAKQQVAKQQVAEQQVAKQQFARQQVAKQQTSPQRQTGNYPSYTHSERFRLPLKTLYMPKKQFLANQQGKTLSYITQNDVDAVMQKKAGKVTAYQRRRELDELWLLIHTDKYQPHSILSVDKQLASQQPLQHNSDFDRVHITCYPSYKMLQVQRHVSGTPL